jgi:nicotinamidase-related amidase
MPARNPDLHGSAPDDAAAALLIVDLISDFEFGNGARVARAALRIAPRIARLKARAKIAGLPTLYVNDNFGRWRSDFRQLVEHALSRPRSEPVIRLIEPEPGDYFVLKPKHSGFYATALAPLLRSIGARTVILTGVASHQCVLFTANDAHLRDLDVAVPRDCIGAATPQQTAFALRYFSSVLRADTRASTRLDLAKLAGSSHRARALRARTRSQFVEVG